MPAGNHPAGQCFTANPEAYSVIGRAAAAAAAEARPIDDFRSGGGYRRQMVETLVARGLTYIAGPKDV